MSNISLLTEVSNLIKFVDDKLTDDNGELRHELTDSGLSNIFIYHDLGDITPFLLELEQYTMLEKIISKLSERLKKEKFLISRSPTFGRFYGFIKSYEYTDFLIGLEDLNRTYKNSKINALLIYYINQTLEIFKFEGSHSSYYHSKLRLSVPIIDSRDTTFIEIFCDLSDSLENDLYLEVALKLFQKFKKIRHSDELKLLPDYKTNLVIRRFLRIKPNYTLMKNHTNTLHAYLRLFEITRNDEVLIELIDLYSQICNKFTISKGAFSDSLSVDSSEASLKASFSMIEFICDYFILIPDEWALNLGFDIAKFWQSKMGKTGLFPMSSNAKISFIDSQTDMTVSLWRIANLTSSKFLEQSADKSFEALHEFHAKQDFALNVDIDKGTVISNSIRTKFVFLYIKALIANQQRKTNLSKLNLDPKFRRLLRDR